MGADLDEPMNAEEHTSLIPGNASDDGVSR
jgi:hypothetical protein